MNSGSSAVRFSCDDEAHELLGISNETGSPERRLILAVLERAILDYVGNEKNDRDQATEWIFGDPTFSPAETFSFEWVCRELDLEPAHIAQKISEMPRRGDRRIAPWYFMKHQEQAAA